MNNGSREHNGGDWLTPILELTDPIGVLSVYVDADPALAAGSPPAWNAPVRSGLRGLVKEAQRSWPREERFALETRLDELQPVVLPSLAARQEGRAAGVAAVLWTRLELSEWESGELRELETLELETEPDPGGSRPATNPSVPQPLPERDRFETGVGARISARVRKAGEDWAREANVRRWDYVVIDGDPRLLDDFELGFGAGESERHPRPR